MKKLDARTWFSFLLIGLAGQFSWTIENMYLNVYLYHTITQDTAYIAAMVAWSAVAATVTTLVMGILSDRMGRRKPFIAVGYLLWGVSLAAFGYVTVDSPLFPAAAAVTSAAITMVVLDCVMTFFGSTANDAAFNAYVTDVTTAQNRGRVEAVLSTLPLISMLVIFGLFDPMTQAGRWKEFFLIFGGLVSLVGLLALFLLQDSRPQPRKTAFLPSMLYGFRPSVMRGNAALYLSLSALCIFSIAVQTFFPYLMIYLQDFLQLPNYALVLGAVLLLASLCSVLGGKLIDRFGKLRFVPPAAGLMLLGLVHMFFARGGLAVFGAGAVMMSGYMLLLSSLSAMVRDHTPSDQAGLFQGVRMVFAVLIPMCTGPYLGSFLTRVTGSGATYEDLGIVKQVPTPWIFLGAAAVLLLLALPIFLLKRRTNHAEHKMG